METENLPKVVLIHPPSPWLLSDREQPPIGILEIGAYLRDKHVKVDFCDLAGHPENMWWIPDGDIYGITCSTPQLSLVSKIVKKIKERQPNAVTVLGGFHPTVDPEKTLEETKADIILKGEGVISMYDIVKGKRDRIIEAPLVEDLNKLPLPAFDMVDMYDYVKMGTNLVVGSTPKMREAKLMTAVGCPYDCAFCASRALSQRKVRYKSVERVIKEIKYVQERYDVDRIYFIDDTFIIDNNRVIELCKELKKLHDSGVLHDWHCLSRADRTNREIYDIMYDSGCRMITYGIESGSQKILDLCNKKITVQQNLDAIKVTKEAGLKVRAQMMVGLPGETDETVEESADFIRKAEADSFGMHIFVPLPGCPIWNNPDKFNFYINKDLTFDYYKTIGKRGEKDAAYLHKNPEQIIKWKDYLVKVIGDRNIVKFAEHRSKELEK